MKHAPRTLLKPLAILAFVLAAAGCAGPSVVQSNKAPGVSLQLQQVLVVASLDPELGPEFETGFIKKSESLLAACKITARVTTDLQQSSGKPDFSAPHKLQVSTTRVEREMRGIPVLAKVDLILNEQPGNKNLWRANIDLEIVSRFATTMVGFAALAAPRGPRGEALATEMVTRMKADGLLPACSAL